MWRGRVWEKNTYDTLLKFSTTENINQLSHSVVSLSVNGIERVMCYEENRLHWKK